MTSSPKPRGVRFAVGTAVFADAVVAIGTVATLAVVARTFTVDDFGLYTVSMRIVGLLQAPLLIGIGITLPRRLPATATHQHARTLITSAFGVILAACFLEIAVGFAFSRQLANLVLGSTTYSGELRGASIAVAGSLIHAFAFAVLRGSLRFTAASTLLGTNIGVVPVVFAVASDTTTQLLVSIGLSWILLSTASIRSYLAFPSTSVHTIRSLIRMGWTRIPGDFALFALPALPPIYVLHASGPDAAGHVSLAVSMVTLTGALFTPLSAVLTPQLSSWQTDDQTTQVLSVFRRMRVLIAATLLLPVGGWILAPVVIPLVFGDAVLNAVPLIQLSLLGAPGYAAYVLIRSFLDGLSDNPVTSYLALFGLCVAIAMLTASRQLPVSASQAAIIALLTGFWTLGSLTYVFARRNLVEMEEN